MANIRAGVIGVGYLGKFHAEKYARMEGVDLVGVVDTNSDTARQVAERLQTAAYTSHRELLDKVQAVSIVVPTDWHYPIAMDFLQKGVDILVEKPMTATVEEADHLIDYAQSRKLMLQVGHLERFNPAVAPLKDIVHKPAFIESHRLSVYQERGTDVSVVLDLMIHDIDIILNFARSEITDIRAAGISVVSDHVDIANARLEFASGCVANVTASRVSGRSERKFRMFQKDAYISVDFGSSEIIIINKDGDPANAIDSNIIPGMNIQKLSFMKWDALEQELKAFVHSVRTREFPEVSGQIGRQALQTAIRVMDQIQETRQRFEQ